MNKFALMLGILLLAGLSFAIEANWMEYLTDKYGCNYYYFGKGYCPDGCYAGLMGIVGDYDSGCDYWTGCEDMGYDLKDMNYLLWGDGTPGMCLYSGCWPDHAEEYTTSFRASMLQYNMAAADFKAKFVAGLKAFLVENPEARNEVLAELQDAMAGYRECIADAYEEGPCYVCGY